MILPIDPQQASEVRGRFLALTNKEGVKSEHRVSVPRQSSSSPQNNCDKDFGRRIAVFAYGLACYAITLGTFLYLAGFVGNLLVPKSMDSPPQKPLHVALVINVLMLGIFAVQHSLMARPAFKQWWTKIVPKPAERSTYLLFSCLVLFLMFWQWQPMGGLIWDVQDPVGRGFLFSLSVFGWLLLLAATFLINHFDLFGLRQVTLYLLGREYTRLRFRTPGLYKLVRHPIYVGWFFVFWATPTMTIAHLVFAVATTAYILIAIRFEERDLVNELGRDYEDYRHHVPMLIPLAKKRSFLQESLN
jgi:protein-S-isoprenylcysteine O-methyltransferase Ste14